MKNYKIFLIMGVVMIVWNYSTAQTPVDSPDVFPNPDPFISEGEVHISASKVHPGNLILSAMTKDTSLKYTQVSRYLSNDYGRTWTGYSYYNNTKVDTLSWQIMAYGDPATVFDAQGNAYIGGIYGGLRGYSIQKCTNPDQGNQAIWSQEIIGYEHKQGEVDKEMITCDDMAESSYANNFYCAWFDSRLGRVKFNRSADGAATFSTPITLGNSIGQGTYLQTGPNGEVYVVWGDAGRPEARFGFARSLDGGNSFSYQTDKAFTIKGIGGHDFNGQLGLSFPSMAVDKTSGPVSFRGRIYLAYPEKTNTNPPYKSEIRVRFSDDKGATWPVSNLKTVSIPEALNCYHQCIALDNATGEISVVYYAIEDSSFNTNVYVAYSTDGGSTFNNLKVSNNSFVTNGGVPGNHYIGIAAYGGVAYPAWYDCKTKRVKVSPVKFPSAQHSIKKKKERKKRK